VTTPITDPLIGRTIAQYKIVARVGGGAMGIVYRARDTKLGRLVALKFLPQQWSHDESAKQRFVREAQAASATNHPNICTIHDIETADDGQLFIVMAFYEGPTLKQRLESGPIAIDEALDIATQIADGLAKAHVQGVVHRDIKPGNVILTEEGVRILDFGLATFVDALKLTAENASFGTPAYMSPEQVRGQAADARSDVWAVGVVLYEMLAGHPPFQGSHAEAIAHAIRNEAPTPLRTIRPEVPQEVEQLAFRALHKEPIVRFQSGRELARALRHVRGLSVPLELRAEPVPSPGVEQVKRSRIPARVVRLTAGVVLVAVLAAVFLWSLPVDRPRVVIAPFGNQTGDSGLDEYRLALTQTLAMALRDSSDVLVTPYARVLEPLGRFVSVGTDVSSRDAIDAVEANTGAALVLVPTLLREGGDWRARVELRDRATATTAWSYETAAEKTALSKDAAYRLALALAEAIEDHFRTPLARARRTLMRLVGLADASPAAHVQSLEAAKAFEEASRSYENIEYAAARRAFASAVRHDPRNPLALAWLSRTAQLTRDENQAIESADQALSRLTGRTPRMDVLFVRAVSAEARRDFAAAEEAYRALTTESPEPLWSMELGAFLDRRERNADAVVAYRRVLDQDPNLMRARLELCRLYSPSRLNEPVEARKNGEAALAGYRSLAGGGDTLRPSGGEGQSLMCLTDTLRVGSSAERAQAQRHSAAARTIFEALTFSYNLARADYYMALMAGVQGRFAEASSLGERALKNAADAGNEALRPIILNNLGAVYAELGERSKAADYYRQAYELYQAWHDETRAAHVQANRGAMLIEYGNPEEGLRDVLNARAVSERLGDKPYEAFCARVLAVYYRNRGRHKEAITELNKGLAIARERHLGENITLMTIHLAQSHFETGDYDSARRLLREVLKDGAGRRTIEARIRLARASVRAGDMTSAVTDLDAAERELEAAPNAATYALLWLVRGELGYEAGRVGDARSNFARAASLWNEMLPQAAAVEARAYMAMMGAGEGGADGVRRTLRASLGAAEKLGQIGLEVRCRLALAQTELAAGRLDEARAALHAIPPDDETRTIGPELRGETHYWWARLHAARGDGVGASAAMQLARASMNELKTKLSDASRASFGHRVSVQRVMK
jgi:FimV-like protein